MAEKEYNKIMELLLQKKWEDLSDDESRLIESYLSRNDILNDSYLISELIEQQKDKQEKLTINIETQSILKNAFEERFTKTITKKKIFGNSYFRLKRIKYSLGIAAIAVGIILILYPFKVEKTTSIDKDYFNEHTQFIDMNISLGEQSEVLMNMDFQISE